MTGTYVFVAWILMQAGEIVLPAFELPNRALRWLILGLAGGLPIVVLAAWWFDVTPQGIRLTEKLDRALAEGRPSADAGASEAEGVSEPEGLFGSSLEMVVLGIGLPLVAFGLFFALLLISPDLDPTEPKNEVEHSAMVNNQPSLAVLPLEDLSSAGEDGGFFAHGMHEDILTHLARVEGLRLISRTSVLAYEGTTKPIREIAEELGVDHILEGSVRRTPTHVRVTVQLIRAATDEHVWADQFDAELSDIFAIQTRIARSIAKALAARVSGDHAELEIVQTPVSPAAYDAYAKARDLHRNADAGNWAELRRSQHLYEEARREDPGFAAAWLNLGILHAEIYWFGFDRTAARAEQAVRCVDEAAGLGVAADQLALAEGILAYYIDHDYGKSLLLFDKAETFAGNSSKAIFYKALVLRRQGALEEALDEQRRGLQLDPLSLAQQEELALTLSLVGRLDESIDLLKDVLARDPSRPRAQMQLWQLEAERAGEPVPVVDGVAATPISARGVQHHGLMFVYSALAGQSARGEEWLRETPVLPGVPGLRELRLAVLSRFSGQNEDAQVWLARADAGLSAALGERPQDQWADLEVQTAAQIAAEHGDFDLALKLLSDRVTEYPIERDLVSGAPPLWDWLVMQLRAGRFGEAVESLDRLTSRVALGSVPFGGYLVLDRWPDFAEARADARWQAAMAQQRPAYVADWN